MGSAITPNQSLTSVVVGTTSETNPTLLLKVNGVLYANGYRIDYSGAYQNFFPGKYGTNILLYCYTAVYGIDLGAVTVPNIEVLVINTAVQTSIIGDTTDITKARGIGVVNEAPGSTAYPVLYRYTTAQQTVSSFATSALITIAPSSVLLLATASEFPSNSVSTVTGFGLTWFKTAELKGIKGSSFASLSDPALQGLEIWYAINNSPLSITDSVIVTYPAVCDNQVLILSNWTGCNLSDPICTPVIITGNNTVGSNPVLAYSTNSTYTTGVYFTISGANTGAFVSGSNWVNINSSKSTGGIYNQNMYSGYKTFATVQPSQPITFPSTGNSGNIAAMVILQS